MTLDKTNELIAMHTQAGSGYSCNTARVVFGKFMRDHRQATVDTLIRVGGLAQSRVSSPA